MVILIYLLSYILLLLVPKVEESRSRRNLTGPAECADMPCDGIVLGWTLGAIGECFDDKYGVLLGEGGYKAIYIQVV